MQPAPTFLIFVSATGASGSVLSLTYDFHAGSGDNGNVYTVTNGNNPNRTANYTYDGLNRITSAWSSGPQWGETYTIDAWGNLTNRSGVSGKTSTEPLNAAPATPKNQLTGFDPDAAGNMRSYGAYVYDGENRLVWTSGYRYVYDGNGERVEKCMVASATTACPTSGTNGKLYWKGTGSTPLAESDLAGNPQEEYIFFNGERIVRRDVSSTGTTIALHYYFSDHLGTHGIVENAAGTQSEQDIDYYPYGGQQNDYSTTPVGQNYKFNGKERDGESGLDNFGARYDTSNLGRFMTPDWAAKPTTVPYANFGNPQSLNLYSYVENNPTTVGDPDGHAPWGLAGGGADCPSINNCQTNFMKTWQDQIFAQQAATQAKQHDVKTAKKYLSKSKTMRPVLKAFESGHFHLQLITDGQDRYDPNTRTVYWDPHSALETTDGGHQTPALGLWHEMAHATGNRHTYDKLVSIADPQFDNKEERRVILNYENPAARELGESTRTNHSDDHLYDVPSPIER